MKNLLLLTLICFSPTAFAQTYRTIDAPIGFLRDEPKVTANIMVRLEERTRVKVLEEINRTWSKVEYVSQSKVHIGYMTNHTMSEDAIIRKKRVMAKSK